MRAATKPHEGRAKAEAERIENEQVVADLRAVMGLPAGRRFMWRTLAATGLYRSSYHPSALIHFNEGQRSVGLTLLAEITAHCPDQYLTMQAEAMEAERKAAERLAVDNMNEDRDNDD